MDYREEPLDFLKGQGRGRLVHHQNTRLEGKRLGDLHDLLLGDSQVTAWGFRVHPHSDEAEQLLGSAMLVGLGNEACAGALLSQENILACA